MAVDTKQKRLSVMALDAAGTGIHTLSDPDGTIERQHLLDCYSGITFASPPGVTLMALERATFRRVTSRVFGRVN